jgi:hypothetical protein
VRWDRRQVEENDCGNMDGGLSMSIGHSCIETQDGQGVWRWIIGRETLPSLDRMYGVEVLYT